MKETSLLKMNKKYWKWTEEKCKIFLILLIYITVIKISYGLNLMTSIDCLICCGFALFCLVITFINTFTQDETN